MSAVPDLEAYFARIGYTGSREPTLETLQAINARHVDAIPFENVAAFLGEPVHLDLESLQAKLLTPGRGGWCFEQNILLSHVLLAMGYEVRRLAARVRWNVAPGVVTPRSHMLLRVCVDGQYYIADTGFGGLTLSGPLRLEPHVEQQTPHEPHRLLPEGEAFVLQARIADVWTKLYVFELHEQQLADYEVSNWYLCNHPESQFLKGVIAARAEPSMRHALRGTRYSIHFPGGRTDSRLIDSVSAYRALLEGPFAIRLPDAPNLDEKLTRMIDG